MLWSSKRMIRHGMAIRWRRLIAMISFLVLCLMLILWTDEEENVSDKILKAIHPSTESVVLSNEETVLVQPWPSKSCQDSGSHQYLLFMIISSPENFERRRIIREIMYPQMNHWERMVGEEFPKELYQIDATIKTLFFVGQPANSSNEFVGEEVYSEASSNGDMVYDNLNESYLNLTVKTLRMLKWVGKHCENVRYLVKLDDDVYLNVPVLLDFLRQIFMDKEKSENLIAGFKYNNIKIDSDPNSKWYTPRSMWALDRFPDFVSGICYVLGSRAKHDLYLHALTTPLFHLEDVFLTGIVRGKYLTTEAVNIPGMHVGWFFKDKIKTFPCNFVKNVVAAHTLTASQIGCYNNMHDYCESKYLSWIPVFLLCN